MRSMYAGVSGLRVHQTKMDVISNNIANINTIGFKRSTVSFKDSFNQTVSASSAANADRGGMNAQQIGMGSNVSGIVNVMTQGAAQRTDYGSDLMIDGEGFFIVKDAEGFGFTRAGSFEVDANGNLVNSSGASVCGWKAVDDPDNPGQQKIIKDLVTPINIYEGGNLYSPAEKTTQVEFTGNFNQDTNPEQKNTISFFDSQGNKYSINIMFTKDTNNPNVWNISLPTVDIPTQGHIEVTINGNKKAYLPNVTLPQNTTLNFNTDGKLAGIGGANGVTTLQLPELNMAGLVDENGAPINFSAEALSQANDPITIDFSTVTQFQSKPTVTSQAKDGNTAGNMTGYSIDSNGIIIGTYSNGRSKKLGQIALADFANPAGLEKSGGSLYRETANSGDFDGIGTDASTIGSSLQGGALEMSNVDLSYEFSEMITTQRGFQANSRIITASDEMIQELVSLKR